MLTADPKIITLAFLGGVIPSLIWLWFWMKEDEENPEPTGLLITVFIAGMLAVIIALPIQKFIQTYAGSWYELKLVLWATVEEALKYLAVLLLLYKNANADEPIDWPIYLITAALGFAAMENTLFLIKPLSISQTTVSLLTSQLRFLGSTLLHTVSSGLIGIAIGLSFFMREGWKKFFLVGGFLVAVALHVAFNFFIIRNEGSNFLQVLSFLWVTAIIIMLLFEKVRRMSEKIINSEEKSEQA